MSVRVIKEGREIKEGDMVRSNGKYCDVQRKLGDCVHKVIAVGSTPSYPHTLIWLECGGGAYCAEGFAIVEGGSK
jgi:hypothetical protein